MSSCLFAAYSRCLYTAMALVPRSRRRFALFKLYAPKDARASTSGSVSGQSGRGHNNNGTTNLQLEASTAGNIHIDISLENENRSPNFQVATVGCWNARSIRLVRASNSALVIVGPRCDIQFSIDIVAALFVTSFASSHRSTQPATFGLAFMPNIRIYMATVVSFQTPPQEGSDGRRQSPELPANLYTFVYSPPRIPQIYIDDAASIAVNGDPLAAFCPPTS
ncbi:hypothetical protein B0H14DRAFT_3658522 [Mycena olivaceomarginata]|nr:hypothetical protein B0H14DRAFT_3658522 [Mycena olivaceomarginata]